jgi:hypothetical protein
MLLVASCNNTEVVEEEIIWKEAPLEDVFIHDGETYWAYGGTVDYDENTSSYVSTTHTKMDCVLDNDILLPLKAPCKKADFGVSTLKENSNYVEGRITKYKFNFEINALNIQNPPDWIIIFQDWVDIDPNDSNGNHPISTLKLKIENERVRLVHFDNSWQFNHIWDENDIEDADHTTHQLNSENGSQEIYVGVEYEVEIIITDGIGNGTGNFTVLLNGLELSNKDYQTKFGGETINAVNTWGIYLSKGYDIGLYASDFAELDKITYEHVLYDVSNQIQISFNNFERYLNEVM